MTPEEHQRRIREIAERVAERLAEHWPEPGAHINALEDFAERMGLEVQREVSEQVIREEAERKAGNHCACPRAGCGGRAFFQRWHGLEIVTAAGRLRVRRPYYRCEGCGHGFCPADLRLGLGPGIRPRRPRRAWRCSPPWSPMCRSRTWCNSSDCP